MSWSEWYPTLKDRQWDVGRRGSGRIEPFCTAIIAVDEGGVWDPFMWGLILEFDAVLKLFNTSLDFRVHCYLHLLFCFIHLLKGTSYILGLSQL